MSLALELGPVRIDERLVGQIGHAAYNQLVMIADRLPRLMAAGSLLKACKDAAGEIPGITPRALYNRVRRFASSGDVLDLVDRREAAALWKSRTPAGLPASFREFYRALREKHGRAATRAHADLITIWRTHYDQAGRYYDRIPGFDSWPVAHPATGIPEGWSYDNLQRAVPEHVFDTAAARQGMAAARNYQPPVRTTRVGMRAGERVEFDDHQFDLKVHFPGQTRAMRPVCFGGVDALSGFGSVSVRPMLWDDEAESKRSLTEFQFRCFVIWWLNAHGFRTDDAGTTLVTEAGTAVIRPDFEARIAAVTGGKVRVDQGKVFAESAHPGQFAPRGKGNPKHKPMIEGWWSVLENVLDRLPGRIGSNQRINGPAEMHGREIALARALDLAKVLPGDLAAEVMLGVMTYGQFARIAKAAIEAVLDDRDHQLEGWDELGFSRMEWRSDSQSLLWLPASDFAALPEAEQMALRPRLMDGGEMLTRAVKLSRREVWQREAGDLRRLSPTNLHRLFSPDDAFEVTVTRQSLVEFQDQLRFGPGVFRFLAQSAGRELYPGDKFSAFFNPMLGRWLQLVDARGAHVALLERLEMPAKNDVEGVRSAIARQSSWVAGRKDRLASRHFDEAETRAHMMEHNQRLQDEAAKRSEKAKGGSGELDRIAKRAAEAGRAMAAAAEADQPMEGELIDEVIAAPRGGVPDEFVDSEFVPMPTE